jgi:hypothetical protein
MKASMCRVKAVECRVQCVGCRGFTCVGAFTIGLSVRGGIGGLPHVHCGQGLGFGFWV